MSQTIFAQEWRDCLSAHYQHVIRNIDRVTEPSLTGVMHEVGFTDAELAEMRVRATMRVEDVPDDFVPDLDVLAETGEAVHEHEQVEQPSAESPAPSIWAGVDLQADTPVGADYNPPTDDPAPVGAEYIPPADFMDGQDAITAYIPEPLIVPVEAPEGGDAWAEQNVAEAEISAPETALAEQPADESAESPAEPDPEAPQQLSLF